MLLLTLNVVVKPFWIFAIDRKVQLLTGNASYGLYSILLSLSVIINGLLDLGITNFNTKNLSQNTSLISQYYNKVIALKLMLSLLYFVVLALAGFYLNHHQSDFWLLMLLGLNQFVISLSHYLRSNLLAIQKFEIESILGVTDKLFMTILCTGMIYYGWFNVNIQNYVLLQTIAYITTLVLLFIVLFHSKIIQGLPKFSYTFSKIVLRESLPYAVLIVLMYAYHKFDFVLIGMLVPDGNFQAGVYAKTSRIIEAASMVNVLFAGLLLPMFSKLIKENGDAFSLLKSAVHLLAIFSVSIGIIGYFHAEFIFNFLYGENDVMGIEVFKILMLSFIPLSISYLFTTFITAQGKLKQLNYAAFALLVVNVIFNLLLIPLYSIAGVAFTALFTQILACFFFVFLASGYFKESISKKIIIPFFIFFITTFLSAFLLNKLIINSYIGILVQLVMIILFTFFTQMFTLSELKKVFKLALNKN